MNRQLKIQCGRNCSGESLVRVSLHGMDLTSKRQVNSLSMSYQRTIASLKNCETANENEESTQHERTKRSRRILDIQMCDLNQHMEDLLRYIIVKQPNGFDGLDIIGEDGPAQAARLELTQNADVRFLPPITMSISFAKILRDVLRGDRGRLHYLSLTSVPISRDASKIMFEDGLKTTRRNHNLSGLMLRGCSFEDKLVLPDKDDDGSCLKSQSPTQHLVQGLRLNTTLKFLDLSLVFRTDHELESILYAIVDHPALTKLDLEGSVVGPRSIKALKTVLQSPKCRIKALDLSQLNRLHGIGKEHMSLDKAGLIDALEGSDSLEQIILNHNNLCSVTDLSRIIRLIRRHPRIYHISYDDFIPDGTPRMKTIAYRSTIRVLLHRNRCCHRFILEAARAATGPSVWPHCIARVNRILQNNHQRGQALFPLVQAFFGTPGAITSTEPTTSWVPMRKSNPNEINYVSRKRKR